MKTVCAGFVLLNITEETDVTWQRTLKENADKYPLGSPLYDWLNAAILINHTAQPGFHHVQLNYSLDLEHIYYEIEVM